LQRAFRRNAKSAKDRAAVDVDDLTLDPGAFLGQQEGNQRCDVVEDDVADDDPATLP
jgi:hypothetical protein